MTTTIVEKKPAEDVKNEEPLAELDPFVPELMGGPLPDMRRFAEDFDPFFAGFGLNRCTAVPAMFRTSPAARWTPDLEMLTQSKPSSCAPSSRASTKRRSKSK